MKFSKSVIITDATAAPAMGPFLPKNKSDYFFMFSIAASFVICHHATLVSDFLAFISQNS